MNLLLLLIFSHVQMNHFYFDTVSPSFLCFVGAVTFTTTVVTAEEQTGRMDLIQEDILDRQIHFVLRQNGLAGFPASSQPLSMRVVMF